MWIKCWIACFQQNVFIAMSIKCPGECILNWYFVVLNTAMVLEQMHFWDWSKHCLIGILQCLIVSLSLLKVAMNIVWFFQFLLKIYTFLFHECFPIDFRVLYSCHTVVWEKQTQRRQYILWKSDFASGSVVILEHKKRKAFGRQIEGENCDKRRPQRWGMRREKMWKTWWVEFIIFVFVFVFVFVFAFVFVFVFASPFDRRHRPLSGNISY